jgi:hypothetical protein
MGRNPQLALSGKEWVSAGGYADFTADEPIVVDYLVDYLSMTFHPLFYGPAFSHFSCPHQHLDNMT